MLPKDVEKSILSTRSGSAEKNAEHHKQLEVHNGERMSDRN